MIDKKIPPSWIYTTVSTICEIKSGNTPKGLNDNSNNGNIPFFKISDMNISGNERYMVNSQILLSENDIKNLKLNLYEEGTIIFPKRGGAIATNKKRILAQKSTYDLNIMGIIPLRINYLFVYYWLQTIDLSTLSDGSNIPQINHTDITDLYISIPPLAEQLRIVTKIEELFTKLEAGVESLKKAKVQLKQYRQSILSTACSGKLTADWRATYKEVETDNLLKNIASERKKHLKNDPIEVNSLVHYLDIPDTWTSISLDTLTTRITSGSRAWKKYYCDHGPCTFILSQNVRPLKLDLSDGFGVNPPEDDPDRRRTEVKEDDLLITIAGNTGDVCRVKSPLPQHYVCQSVALVRPAIKEISPYLELFLNSPDHGQLQFNKMSYGQGRPHLLLDHIKATSILFPPLLEQQEIVRRVDALLSMIGSIEAYIDISIKQADIMRQAILKNAFSGKLVPQDPNDEPAEKLLERIRAERESANLQVKKNGSVRRRGKQSALP